MNHRDYIVVILLGAFALGLVLVLSGCTTVSRESTADSKCEVEIYGVLTAAKLTCSDNIDNKFDIEDKKK